MNFTWESLEQARKNKESIFKAYARIGSAAVTETGFSAAPFLERFIAACEDDLNTPLGLAILQELVREINVRLDAGESLHADVRSGFETMLGVFGLRIEAPVSIPEDILALAQARETARNSKDFAEADRLRDEVSAHGYTIEDTPTGPRVTRR